MKLSTPDYSSYWSHAIAYSKTPPITVAAILKSTVFSLITTPPWKLILLLKIGSDDIWTSWTELAKQKKLVIFVQKLWCYELNEVDPILVQRLYLGQTLMNQNKTCYASSPMIWGPRPKLAIAPPMGRELPTFTFWLITFEQSVRKLKYLCLWIPCVVPIRRCQLCQIDWTPCRPFWNLSYIFISSEPFDISSQKSVGIINIMSWTYHRSMKTAPPTVREILRSLKKRLTFEIMQICTFDSFVPWVKLILTMSHLSFSKMRLSAILK